MIIGKALQKAKEHRARFVTIFLNGEPFKPQFRVTIMQNRDFLDFNKLLDYLTERTKLPIKYVFDINGQRLNHIDQLQHNCNYICSTTVKFQKAQYGKMKHNFQSSFSSKKFLRPLSSKNKYSFRNIDTESNNSNEYYNESEIIKNYLKKPNHLNFDQNLSNDIILPSKSFSYLNGKIVTIINKKFPNLSSRVLLNFRSARTFENIIKDLGESVSLPKACVLLTTFGNEIRSISQLRRSLNEVDTFFVDDFQFEKIKNQKKATIIENLNEDQSLVLKNNNPIEQNDVVKQNDSLNKDTKPNNNDFEINTESSLFINHQNQLNDEKSLSEFYRDYLEEKSFESQENSSISPDLKKTKLSNTIEQSSSNSLKANSESEKIDNFLINKNVPNKSDFNHNTDINNENIENEIIIKEYIGKFADGIYKPDKNLKLKKVFGYLGENNNLLVLPNGEIVYYVGLIIVIWDSVENSQRFYFEHTEDVFCIDIDYENKLIVSTQKGKNLDNQNFPPQIRIWNYYTLETVFIIENFNQGANVVSVIFCKTNFLAILYLIDDNLEIDYWDWKNKKLISNVSKHSKNKEIYGIKFHPGNDNILISYGKKHLSLWKIQNNKLFFESSFENIFLENNFQLNCLSFFSNDTMIITDTKGSIFVWSFVLNENIKLELVTIEKNAHDAIISSLLVFPNIYIVTGDVYGILKTWAFQNSKLILSNVAVLPTTSGSIRSLAFFDKSFLTKENNFLENTDNEKFFKILIGTSANMIFSGSVLQATQYNMLYEGHNYGIRAIAVDPIDKNFFTAGIDHKICKWSKNLLLWSVRCKYKCVSIAVYPGGKILAVGCTNGIICILRTVSGKFINQINLSDSAIGCLGYSPDSLLLAAGTENGMLHILPVFENGLSYDKMSLSKCNYPILNLQWSKDCKFILTTVNDNGFQEIILWNLNESNFSKGTSIETDKIEWYDATCLSGNDVKGIWENDNLNNVINLCCHCSLENDLIATGDENGNVRLFVYPCTDNNASFYFTKQSSNAVTEIRFLKENNAIITSSLEGSVFIWELFKSDVNETS